MQRHRYLRLSDIATTSVRTVLPDSPLRDAIALMAQQHVSCVVVAEGLRPLGILTERDIVRVMSNGLRPATAIGDVMSQPLLTARMDLDFPAAQNLLARQGIRHLVVTDDAGQLWGIVTESDFRAHLNRDLFSRIRSIESVMDPEFTTLPPDAPLQRALDCMSTGRCDHVVVTRQGSPVGILTERDVPRLMLRGVNPSTTALDQVMSSPVQSIRTHDTLATATDRMDAAGIRHMVALDEQDRLAGVVSQHRMLERLGATLLDEMRSRLQDRLDVILDATGVGTWEYDYAAGRLTRNAALWKLLGVDAPSGRDETLDAAFARVHPDDLPRLRTIIEAAREQRNGNDEPFSYEYRVLRPDGSWLWLRTIGRNVDRDDDGLALGAAGITIDISGEKAATSRATESEHRFRRLMERLPIPVMHIARGGRCLFLNDHFQQIFGYTIDDLPHSDAWRQRAFPDRDLRARADAAWREAFLTARRHGQAIAPQEFRVVCKDGSVRIVDASGIVLGDDFLATFVDVTERKSVQEQLSLRLAELNRWYDAMLGREGRVLELKREVNALLRATGQPIRYPSADQPSEGRPA